MVFKNESELKNFLLPKCKDAVFFASMEVHKTIDRFVKEFYADYDPVMYERTNQLLHSLVMTNVVQVGNGYEAQVYFDLSSLNYITGRKPSGEQVVGAADNGGHGALGLRIMSGNTGVGIWSDPMELMDIIGILKEKLIAQGIPIK